MVRNWGARGVEDVPFRPNPLPCEGRGKIWQGSAGGEGNLQNAGKPSVHEGGKLGVQGAQPPGRGFGGCAPENIKKGTNCSH